MIRFRYVRAWAEAGESWPIDEDGFRRLVSPAFLMVFSADKEGRISPVEWCVECDAAEGWARVVTEDQARAGDWRSPKLIRGNFAIFMRPDHPVPQYVSALEVAGHG